MFQFRFVILALLIPLAGLTALVVGTGAVYGVVMPPYESTSSATTAAGIGAVATFASRSVDAAATAASDPDVASAVSKGELTPAAEAALLAKAGMYGAPSFALVLGVDGAVRAKSGLDPNLEPSLGGFPVVAEALTGVARDGVIMKDGAPIHVAASPSYDDTGVLAGAVLLGWPYTEELVATFGRASGGRVVVVGPKGVIGALPEGVGPAELAAKAPFGEPTRNYGPMPILMPDVTRYFVGALPLYASEPNLSLVSITDRDAAYDGIAAMQVGVLGASAVLLALVLGIILSTLRAMRRPLELIEEHLSQVQQHGPNVGILPEAGLGPMLRLGKQLNMLLQTLPAARPGGTAPLFGQSSTSSQDVQAPSFSGDSSPPQMGSMGSMGSMPPMPVTSTEPPAGVSSMSPPPSSNPSQPTPRAPALSTPPTSPALSEAPPSNPGAGGIAGLFDDGPDPLAAFRVPATQVPTASPPPPPPPPAPEPHAMQPEATVMFQVPESLLAASATSAPKAPTPAPTPSAPAQVSRTSVDDNRTVVAQVPQELLAQVSPKNDVDSADEAHYKEVYEKFVQTRIECGEDTSDLSYDRFVAKLLKNRQQIIEKHKAKSVRFQVYAKDGKAALRALPVRD